MYFISVAIPQVIVLVDYTDYNILISHLNSTFFKILICWKVPKWPNLNLKAWRFFLSFEQKKISQRRSSTGQASSSRNMRGPGPHGAYGDLSPLNPITPGKGILFIIMMLYHVTIVEGYRVNEFVPTSLSLILANTG